MMKTIFVFLADGFEEIEAITPIDVLRRAGLNVQTVSVMDKQTVSGAHGIPVVADKMFADIHLEDAEMLLLPGGLPGATNLDAHQGLSKMIMAKIFVDPSITVEELDVIKTDLRDKITKSHKNSIIVIEAESFRKDKRFDTEEVSNAVNADL